MYKTFMVIVFFAFISFSHAKNIQSVYQTNCLSCHAQLAVGIDKFFYRYLLLYSDKKSTTQAIKNYLKAPSKEKSTLTGGLLGRFGVKKPTKLSEKELNEAVNEYWKKYNLIGKLH